MRFLIFFFFLALTTNATKLSDVNILFAELVASNSVSDTLKLQSCASSCGGRQKLCYCDAKCEFFGDCCFDYWAKCDSTHSNEDLSTALDSLTPQVGYNLFQHKSKVDVVNRTLYVSQDMLKREYYLVYSVLQKYACPGGQSGFNVDACSTSAPTFSGATSDKLLVSYYDKSSNIIYRNYYCGKCNGALDESLMKMNYTIVCGAASFTGYNQVEMKLENAATLNSGCSLVYETLNDTNIRYYDDSKDSWNKCTIQPSDVTAFILNLFKTLQGMDSSITMDINDAKFCELYLLPLNLTAASLINEKSLSFRNIHCLKCWLAKNGFNFKMFTTIQNDPFYLLKLKNANGSILISLIDPANYKENIKKMTPAKLTDVNVLINRYKAQLDSLQLLKEPAVSSTDFGKLFETFDSINRSLTEDKMVSYFMRQANKAVWSTENPISTYQFTLHMKLFLNNNAFQNTIPEFALSFMTDEMKIQIFPSLITNFFATSIGMRYGLVGEVPVVTINFTKPTDMHSFSADVYILIKFNIFNVQVLNNYISNLLLIIEEIFNMNFELFDTSPESMFSLIELINGVYNFTAKPASYHCSSVTGQNVIFIGDVDNQFKKSKVLVVTDKNENLIHRVGGINGLEGVNTDASVYKDKYHFSVYSEQQGNFQIKICYDSAIKDKIFTSADLEKDNCELENKMYSFNNPSLAAFAKMNEDNWGIGYNSSQDGLHYIKIKSSLVSRLGNNVYLFCVNQTDNQTTYAIALLNQRYKVSPASVNFVEPILDSSSIHSKQSSMILVTIFILISKFSA